MHDEDEHKAILKYWFDVKRAIDELDAVGGWIPVTTSGRRRRKKGARK